ncbi:MAG: hypothetical protein H0T20_00440 [Actinobacteria bacterium]|nr:hypothetical protein [Actinomycetota bacterium]
MKIKIVLLCALVALGAAATAFANGSGGVTGPAFYFDNDLYRTVGTPTDLTGTGAPAHSFDTIYALAGQPNVSTVAPGSKGYNGGRWMVHAIAYNTSWAATVAAHDANGSGDLDSAAEVRAALADPGAGGAVDTGVVKSFVCPVIKL